MENDDPARTQRNGHVRWSSRPSPILIKPNPTVFHLSRRRVWAMFIAIIGTRFSGKSSLEEYLVSDKGFTSVRILESDRDNPEACLNYLDGCSFI